MTIRTILPLAAAVAVAACAVQRALPGVELPPDANQTLRDQGGRERPGL